MNFPSASKGGTSSYSPKRVEGGIGVFFEVAGHSPGVVPVRWSTLLMSQDSVSTQGFAREDPVSELSKVTGRARSLPNN